MKTGKYIENSLLCGYCNGNGFDAGQEVCKPCRGTGLENKQFFKVADLKEVEGMMMREEITYTRMVEILNERTTKYMFDWVGEKTKNIEP